MLCHRPYHHNLLLIDHMLQCQLISTWRQRGVLKEGNWSDGIWLSPYLSPDRFFVLFSWWNTFLTKDLSALATKLFIETIFFVISNILQVWMVFCNLTNFSWSRQIFKHTTDKISEKTEQNGLNKQNHDKLVDHFHKSYHEGVIMELCPSKWGCKSSKPASVS